MRLQLHDDKHHIRALRNTLTMEQKAKVLYDLRKAPAWMHLHSRAVAPAHRKKRTNAVNQPQPRTSEKLFAPAEAERIAESCREFGVRELYLFGSLVRGEANEKSDVDLLVEFERDGVFGAFEQFMGFKERMESILGRPVDVVTAKRFRNPYFRRTIETEKQLIYAA